MDVLPYIFLFYIFILNFKTGVSENTDDLPVDNPKSVAKDGKCNIIVKSSEYSANSGSTDNKEKICSPRGDKGESGDKGPLGAKGESGDKGPLGDKGVAGDKGPPGDQGLRGDKGTKGDLGENGIEGLQGRKGELGDKGTKGEPGEIGGVGLPGIIGLQGPRGDIGPQGNKGESGDKGPQGNKGESGDKGKVGPRGPEGPPGPSSSSEKCTCSDIPTDEDIDDGTEKYKSITRPAKSCQYLHELNQQADITAENDYFYVNKKNPFKVNCRFDTLNMCLEPTLEEKSNIFTKLVNVSSHEFWLSGKEFNIEKFYGITNKQLEWLQAQAASKISQTIRIHCKNFNLKPRKSLQLLTWNYVLFDFKSTSVNPQFYTVLPENDFCKDFDGNIEEIKSSDIYIEGRPDVLPVTDFLIRNFNVGKHQAMWVELLDLCVDFEEMS